eukprot:TRINITY_DN39779_c0_g1_i1.p2 TRINITY_DN39779_c0_g1~~TRINITY_DN39779_c0_g1_i1.p2  ORF type:complete len:107 (-),score=13.12 TRINITY_DN39779_c0_g1_i1:71-391(-)
MAASTCTLKTFVKMNQRSCPPKCHENHEVGSGNRLHERPQKNDDGDETDEDNRCGRQFRQKRCNALANSVAKRNATAPSSAPDNDLSIMQRAKMLREPDVCSSLQK